MNLVFIYCFLDWHCNETITPSYATESSRSHHSSITESSPNHAINGNQISLHFTKINHFFTSSAEHFPWLQVLFDTNVTVHRVAITNRFDFRDVRFRKLTVSIGNLPAEVDKLSMNPICAYYEGPSDRASSIVLTCYQPLTGTYLIVQQATPTKKYHLKINEVFVCGN